ncbi:MULTISPECIES: paraquat-inducible protein A [unclassified Pseudoalteromonas]|uniref:paraquat-inducible protein A n=1 Tax=unclassified Pseudoalteromonas TaxID=194690 RepID=UPI0015FA418B|nr:MULTISPECIES: paraquat-inducible protein A [unclassified Pseudoalteromonas]MBB1275756.1 paraquat-inducible protein A [Pseudoalteromonas sp. SR43-3]MBB1305594.1 paraquat-inducible protein A [Pseudoalteromonas sp. SR43-5]MBB1451493.1 paraquat-inducible protein A [Pseudoalteromonas sp. SG43-1]
MRNWLSVISVVVALCLLFPGITKPVLTIEGNIDKSKLAQAGIEMLAEEGDGRTRSMLMMFSNMLGLDKLEGEISAYNKTQSILGTVQELSSNNNLFVAALVGLFSIVIPSLKLLLQLLYCCLPLNGLKQKLGLVICALSKWSMVDVFVIALIVTYLAGNAHGKSGELLVMNAQFGEGFWYFSAYCIFAIIASNLIKTPDKPQST